MVKLSKNTFTHKLCEQNIYAEDESAIISHEENCDSLETIDDEDPSPLSPNDVQSFMMGRCKTWDRTFGSVLMHSGDLHIEINSAKYILNILLKPLCGIHLANVFGRSSEKSFEYFYSGKDAHHTYELIHSFYIAGSLFLIELCKRNLDCEVTEEVYREWISSERVSNPNVLFLHKIVFGPIHHHLMFRLGIRYKDVEMKRAGKFMLGKIFFSANRSNYHSLMYHDICLEVNLPKRFKKFYDELSSHGCSVWKDTTPTSVGNFDVDVHPLLLTSEDRDKVGHCEGGDAKNEEVNKLSKEFLKNDIDESSWTKAFKMIPLKAGE